MKGTSFQADQSSVMCNGPSLNIVGRPYRAWTCLGNSNVWRSRWSCWVRSSLMRFPAAPVVSAAMIDLVSECCNITLNGKSLGLGNCDWLTALAHWLSHEVLSTSRSLTNFRTSWEPCNDMGHSSTVKADHLLLALQTFGWSKSRVT